MISVVPLKDNIAIFVYLLRVFIQIRRRYCNNHVIFLNIPLFKSGSGQRTFYYRIVDIHNSLYSSLKTKLPPKNDWFFPSDVRYSLLLGIFRKFHFPIAMDNCGGYIFFHGGGGGRSFIVASYKDLGANLDVSLPLLLTSNRRSFWLPYWLVWVGEAVVTNFW